MKLKWKILASVLGGLSSVVLIAPIAISCSGNGEKIATPKPVFTDNDATTYLGNIWNMQTAEKNAMAYTQYKSAVQAFDKMKTQTWVNTSTTKPTVNAEGLIQISNPESGKFIPVVFMDIDETVLNNYAFQNYLILNDKSYTPSLWDKYVNTKISKKISGALNFIRHVWDNGGVVMFNSNREQSTQLQSTIQNLINEGLEKKYLPKWSFWMQGVNLATKDPWNNINTTTITDPNTNQQITKVVKSSKEDRMNFVNENTFDLSAYGSGNAVKFRTIMRIGDNFNDFNDNATMSKDNQTKIDILETDIKNLFGNFDTSIMGLKYFYLNKILQKTNETWSESYVQIGGNVAYGDFVSGIVKSGWYSLDNEQKISMIKNVLKTWVWSGPNAS